jgi:hypothetical protein
MEAVYRRPRALRSVVLKSVSADSNEGFDFDAAWDMLITMRTNRIVVAGVVCEAIRTRSRLEFDYKGRHRIVEPYCHGVSTRDAEVLRAVQVGGQSSSGGLGLGKLWYVDDIVNPRLLSEQFDPDDPHYNPDDTAMKTIHCRIEKP